MTDKENRIASPIVLTSRWANSAAFEKLFKEGMQLLDDVSHYLDGQGRDDCKALERVDAVHYASESMRLSTRLMQLASWLLLQRAANDGEMTSQHANQEKEKIHFEHSSQFVPEDILTHLPKQLSDYILKAQRLQERIMHLDKSRDQLVVHHIPAPSPIDASRQLLENAFSRI